MKKFSLTHKLLAVALAFVLVAVSLPDYLSFAQQPAQEQSETDEFEDNLADGDPSDDDLSGDNPSDTGEQEMEQQVVLHLQAPETVPMGTAGSFGLSAQNTAATAAAVSIQLTQEEMEAYQTAEQDGTLALQSVGDSLTFTLQPGEQVEGTLSFLYPNGYSSREVVEIAEEDISIVLQQFPEEETGGTPIETIPPEGEIQTPPTDEAQQPGGEGPTDPSDEEEPTPPESGDGEEPTDPSDGGGTTPPESGDGEEATDPSDGEETPPLESGDGEDLTDPSDGGETTPPESGDGEEATDPSDGENETLPPESGDGEEATDPSNEEEANLHDDETDPSVGEGEAMPSDEQEQVLQTVEQSTVSLTQDYKTGPDGELSEEPTTDSEPADESGTTENEGSTEPSGSESGNPTGLENTGSTDSDNAGTGDNSSGGTEDDQQGNDPTGLQGDGQQGNDPTGSQGDGQQDGGPTESDDTGSSAPTTPEGNDPTGTEDNGEQEQPAPQVSFDIAGATLTFTASFGWGELTLTAQPLETEQQEAAAQGAVPQPDLSYTIEAASQNRETTGTIYTRSWSLQQVIALPQGASFVEGEAAVDGNQIRIGATPVLSVDDQSGTAGELSAQRDGETLLVTYTKTLSDWQSLEAESISDLGLAMTLHQEAIVRDESFTEGQVDVGATFTATPVTAAAEIAPAAVLAVLDTGDEQQDGSQSVTQQGSLSLPLSGEPQSEQPQSGGADIAVTYTGEAVYTEQDALAVRYTIEVTNNNTADPETPEGGESGEEEQPEGSDGAVKVKIVQNLNEWFSGIATQEPNEPTGDWDESAKTLTWENVEIEAGDTWTRTVTVLIDNTKISSIDDLSKNLSSTVSVHKAGEESSEETPPLDRATVEVNLKDRVESEGIEVKEEGDQTQTVYWLDNNASGNRPDPKDYLAEVGLEFDIGDEAEPGDDKWIALDEDNMAQLGLTKMPDILCPEDNTESQWMLSAELPTEIGYKGTDITQQVKWRMTPPAEDAEIPAGPEEGGIRPNLSEVYYLDKVEGEGSETWYYLYRDEVSFNIDLRDAVNADQIEAEELEKLLRDHFTLSYEAGTEDEKPLSWEDITVDIEEVGDGQYTLTLVNAVAYSRNGEGVHYYLKPMGSEDQETQISLDRNWPGNGEGGDYYDVECDNTGLDNVGNITDKVANGGTLVLTRQGEIAYQATKVWIDPDGNTDGRPEGHFELWRYTYSEDGGSFKEATTVTGVENVSFEDIKNGEITFTNPNPTDSQKSNFFPKYDKDGNRYVYIMKEVIESTEDALSYEQIFGEVNPATGAVKDTRPPVEDESWERDEQDNFVYNKGTITNRINEKETVSVTKKWDAASFQASLEDVEVKVGLYGKPVDSNQNWEPVKGPDGENLVYTMDAFFAANDTMSQTVTVNTYNGEGKEMEYRFFEISVNGVPILKEEDLAAGAHLQDKEFTIKLDNGQELSFVSQRVDDEEIEETGEQVIENVIQDEITYTINKEWIEMDDKDVRFAIYQQGPNAENKLVGIVTLDGTVDTEGEHGDWSDAAGNKTTTPTLTVGDKTYNVTYQVTADEHTQLVIEGLPRYDEHGYTYEYIALEVGGSPEQTTEIDEDGNYITDVINGPGRGYRIMLRKRWIDNSDIEHREPVKVEVYYHDEANPAKYVLLTEVTLGEEGEPWYELVGFSEVDLKEKLGDAFPEGDDFYKHLYIREISIGNSGADDRTTQGGLSTEEDGAIKNSFVDQIAATNHTYEATYETQLGGLTVEEGEDTPGISDPLFIVTNRRLGNVDLTVTKEWQDGSQLQELLKGSNVVPVVKLVFDEEKNNAEPMEGTIEEAIDYTNNTVTIGNEAVEIKGKDGTSPEEAIQPLLENGELNEELYFYNLPKYDNQGRVARYKVEELWTTKDNIENGKVKKVDECYELENFLNYHLPESTSDDLKSLLSDLSVSYREDSYEEKDEQKQNDEQKITITNKLTGTKEIKFYKEWNDQYALEHGKRPDLYLTLYQTTKGSGKMQLYADHSWDKQALTISEDGGENAAQAEKETDENYWICTFPDLPKYDEKGDEYIYYAVERLTVNDPSDFDYAPAQFKYDGVQDLNLTVEYDEDGKVVELPSVEVDDHRVLIETDESGDVALLEGGTFVNSLEEAVTITGRKLWNSVPLTADSADLPTVTFEVYQYLESEVPTEDLHENLDPNLKVATREIKSEEWENLKTDDNQYEFKFDGMEGKDGNTVPFPLYNEKGERYVYILHEVTDEVSDTDWDLVYEDPVYNEYQITNTYDPQLGALSVKKLLEVEPYQEHYPSIRFRLYQVAPDSAGKYDEQNAVLYREESWSSEDVEKAIGNTPSVLTTEAQRVVVEETFTFENLPIYAPNGEKYQYFVAEILDDGSGYEMNYEAAVKVGSYSTVDEVFQNGKTETTEIVTEEDGTEIITIALKTEPIEVTPNEDWDHENDGTVPTSLSVSNTFGDKYIPEAISLTGTKVWNDQGNALGLRPELDDFKNHVKLYRYAEPQEGQYNGIGSSTSPILVENASFTWSGTDTDTWNYEITGLEQYAPNGMPWIYVVKEDMTGIGEDYIVSPPDATTTDNPHDARVEKPADEAENQVLELDPLTNSLTTSQSFQKQWQNGDGGSITEDYLGLGDITITGQLWVGEKGADGNVIDMKKASDYFTKADWIGEGKWWDKEPIFTVDLTTRLGDNGKTANILNLPRVNKDSKELVYAIVEAKIKVTNPDYTQTFTWKWEDGKLTVKSQDPLDGLFTPQEITVGGSPTIVTNSLKTTDLSVEKKWEDNDNIENLRPTSIDVVVQRKVQQKGGNQSEQAGELTRATLMAPRTTEDGWEFVPDGTGYLTETLEEATGWKASIPNLPTYGIQDNGLVTYDYRIRELKQGWKPDTIEDSILDANEKYDGHYTVSSYDEDGSTLTVTNTLTHMDIIAVKAWKQEGLHGSYAEVTFTLQSRVVGSGDDAWKDVVDAGGKLLSKKLTGEEDPAWTVTWTELPRTENGQTLEYRVVEKLADGLKEEEHVQFSITPETISSESADKTFTFTVTNIPLGQITVTKKGEDGGLPNVEFTLTGNDGKSYEQTTSADGTAIFTGFPLYDSNGTEITYTLEETSTPDGYIQLTELIKVTFTAADQPNGGIYWETTDGKYLLHKVEYEVVNGQYFPVLHTGGSGFYWPGVLGAGAAAAGVLYLIRRKTKGHNTER